MDAELTALAATGATTLVSLMVTDSWGRARALTGRLLRRAGANTGRVPPADLDAARDRLLRTAGPEEPRLSRRDVTEQCRADLYRMVATGTVTVAELGALVDALQELDAAAPPGPGAVHNVIEGGVQHAPVIQSGHITRLTVHAPPPPPGPDGPATAG
jgi:hypothetical protein